MSKVYEIEIINGKPVKKSAHVVKFLFNRSIMSKVYEIEIINGKPVKKSAHVVNIVDYVYNQLAETGEYDMIINDQSLLAESKRLNDEMRYCLEARNI